MESISLAVAGGFRIVVPGHPKHLSTYVFLEFEDWMEDEAPFLRQLFGAGERVLDVGANLGFYSLTAARLAGPEGRIWSFEPTPEVARRLRASIALNAMTTVEVVECALGDRRGTARLARAMSSELNRIVDAAEEGEDVALDTLDGWSAETPAARGISFVKLDVEGQEDAVIAGGRDFFARESPVVMMEVTEDAARVAAAMGRLRSLGYESFRLLPELGILAPLAGSSLDPFTYNLFLAKPDRAEALVARGRLMRASTQAEPAPAAAMAAFILGLAAIAPHRDGFGKTFAKLDAGGAYGTALRYYVTARDETRSPSARAAALLMAHDAAEAALAERASVPRLLSAGRIARAAGFREKAVAAAQKLAEALMQGAPMTIGEPFLPMLPDYETWVSPAGLQGWIGAMIIEARWRWEGSSTYFHNADFAKQDPVALLRRFGREAPFFERRRVLNAWIEKKPVQPHPMLLRHAPDNLNPEYWSGQPVPAPTA